MRASRSTDEMAGNRTNVYHMKTELECKRLVIATDLNVDSIPTNFKCLLALIWAIKRVVFLFDRDHD